MRLLAVCLVAAQVSGKQYQLSDPIEILLTRAIRSPSHYEDRVATMSDPNDYHLPFGWMDFQ